MLILFVHLISKLNTPYKQKYISKFEQFIQAFILEILTVDSIFLTVLKPRIFILMHY